MVEGGNTMIFRDYFLTQKRELIMKQLLSALSIRTAALSGPFLLRYPVCSSITL